MSSAGSMPSDAPGQAHPGCRHSHRSSVCWPFSLQTSLQYFPHGPPSATMQLHEGCAHFLGSAMGASSQTLSAEVKPCKLVNPRYLTIRSVDQPPMLIGAVLADRFSGQPFGRSAAAALFTDAELRCARLARALQQRRERVEEFVFWQASPLQHADTTRFDRQRMCHFANR